MIVLIMFAVRLKKPDFCSRGFTSVGYKVGWRGPVSSSVMKGCGESNGSDPDSTSPAGEDGDGSDIVSAFSITTSGNANYHHPHHHTPFCTDNPSLGS